MLNVNRESVITNFETFGLVRTGIKPECTVSVADILVYTLKICLEKFCLFPGLMSLNFHLPCHLIFTEQSRSAVNLEILGNVSKIIQCTVK